MIRSVRYFRLAFFLLLLVPKIASALPDSDHAPDLLVDDDKVQCPTATFTTIQAAINAANPGAMIRVCAGTYTEQLSITKRVSIEADNGAILMPGAMISNANDSSGTPTAAAIFVNATDGVEIEGLVVDAANNGLAQCAPRLIGIFFLNASGTVEHNAVRNTKLSTALNGCQSGDAIVVESSGGLTSKVQVLDNSVHDYQKNGVTGNETGTNITVRGNAITGSGPTTGAAQNGIQVAFGATGVVRGNIVSGNVFAPCISLTTCTASGTGILLFQSDNADVEYNSITNDQVSIYVGGNNNTIAHNNIAQSLVFVGIDIAGNSNDIGGNDISNSGQAAVLLEGNDNTVHNNELNEAPFGILKLSGTVGNTHAGNSYYANLIAVQDPALPRSTHVSPSR